MVADPAPINPMPLAMAKAVSAAVSVVRCVISYQHNREMPAMFWMANKVKYAVLHRDNMLQTDSLVPSV